MKQFTPFSLFAIAFFAIALFATAACTKPTDPIAPPTPETKGTLRLTIDSQVNGVAADFGIDYTNSHGDTFQITKLNYYLSNFIFIKADGSEYKVPKDSCYFLVSQDNAESHNLVFRNVPSGEYKAVKFTLGIDSLKSVSNVNSFVGVLDPAHGAQDMYWGWNEGYIFFKLEGTSPQIPTDINGNHPFAYHVGGFGIGINNLKKYNLPFGAQTLAVGPTYAHILHVVADVGEVFKTPNTVSIFQLPNTAFDSLSLIVSANYADMFRTDHIH
jgi:hypothetical protein